MELKDYSVSELYNEIYNRKSTLVDLGKAKIKINPEGGGGVYHDIKFYNDFNDSLYKVINEKFKPKNVIDIGANIGLYSICFGLAFPDSTVLIFEPNSDLINNIESNLKLNNLTNYEIHNMAVGDKCENIHFQINEKFTVDSRCSGLENFKKTEVQQTTLDEILKNSKKQDFTFIKIDVQGYEERVINGGQQFFKNNKNFIIKLEYAPFWLLSQKTNPRTFLAKLIEDFQVIEFNPFGYRDVDFDFLIKNKLENKDLNSFVNYCENLNRNKLGHLDLLLLPKEL